MILHSYNRGRGIKALRDSLRAAGEHTLILDRMPLGKFPTVVCWGTADVEYPRYPGMTVLNPPELSRLMSNKLLFFQHVKEGPGIPVWTTDPEVAKEWPMTVVRHNLNGHGGDGIQIVKSPNPLPPARLYVKYQKKSSEFRLHMFKRLDGDFECRHLQKKVRMKDRPDANLQVRNHQNGFVFQHNDVVAPDCVTSLGPDFMRQYFPGMDFAALDVIYSKKEDSAWVLEGNTAPGLEGKTIEVYTEYLLERKELRF